MIEKTALRKELEDIVFKMSPDSLKHLPDYNQRLMVLKELGYINEESCLEMKGKVACLMSEHELTITELLVANVLGPLSPEEIASVISAFVFQQKTPNESPNLSPNLEKAKTDVEAIHKRIESVEKKCNLKQYEFNESLKYGLMEVVYEWAKGTRFSQVVQYTEVQEGIIVRTIQRLDEMLKDVKSAAKLFGDNSLADKMEAASKCIRRDIVFAASLYTQSDD
jgi:antiviral helicase SKI2